MIRPERLHLTENGGGIEATLIDAVFQGPVVRCALRTPDGVEVVAHVGSEGERPALAPGRSYRLAWEADAARLLPRSRTTQPLDLEQRTTLDLAGSR